MAKTLTIKFKGVSNLAYLSLFPEDLFDQIDTIEDVDFNVSDLSAFEPWLRRKLNLIWSK